MNSIHRILTYNGTIKISALSISVKTTFRKGSQYLKRNKVEKSCVTKMVLPLEMSNSGYMYRNWLSWKRCFLDHMHRHDYVKNTENTKINFLRKQIGSDALNCKEVYNILYNSHTRSLSNFLNALDDFFRSKKNELLERFNFFTRSLRKDETLQYFILDLKEKASTCNFGNQTESLIRDKVIASIDDGEFRSNLFCMLNLELKTLEKICIEYDKLQEASAKNNLSIAIRENNNSANNEKIIKNVARNRIETKTVHSDNILVIDVFNVNDINLPDQKQYLNKKVNTVSRQNFNTDDQTKTNFTNGTSYKRSCWKCNKKHGPRCCPAWKNKCDKCGERNHFSYCCQMKTSKHEDNPINFTTFNSDSILRENKLKPTPANPCNNNIPVVIETWYPIEPVVVPSAPEIYENEYERYPNLHDVASVQEIVPTPANPCNNDIPVAIETWYPIEPVVVPSAPEIYENEYERYPNLHDVASVQEIVPVYPEADPQNTATGSKQRKTRWNSDLDPCSIF